MKQILLLAASVSLHLQYNRPLINTLCQMGYQVHVACSFTEETVPKQTIQDFREFLKSRDISVHELPFARTLFPFSKNREAKKQLQALLQDTAFDLIHCFGTVAGFYGRAEAKQRSIPVFYSALDFRVFRNGSRILNGFFKRAEQKNARHTSVFFATNPENASYATQKLHIGEVHTLPACGIDPKATKLPEGETRQSVRHRLQIPEDAIVLLSISDLTWSEYQRSVLQAISRLPKLKLYYLLCGMGKDKAFLQKLCKHLHLEDRVQFLDLPEHPASLYAAADLYCLPSKREALGSATLEAMAAGLPLLTSNRNGMQFYNDGSHNGRTFVCGEIQSLANAIAELAGDKALREKMGQANQEASKAWTQDKVLPVLEETYRKYVSP